MPRVRIYIKGKQWSIHSRALDQAKQRRLSIKPRRCWDFYFGGFGYSLEANCLGYCVLRTGLVLRDDLLGNNRGFWWQALQAISFGMTIYDSPGQIRYLIVCSQMRIYRFLCTPPTFKCTHYNFHFTGRECSFTAAWYCTIFQILLLINPQI